MYSERRQTWRKSALANNTFLSNNPTLENGAVEMIKEHSTESRQSNGDATDEGRPSDSINDSFFRGPVSRQSSSGSGFFSGSAESSGRQQSNNYRTQSRPGSRTVGLFVDSGSVRGSSELPYAERDSLNSDSHFVSHHTSSNSANTNGSQVSAPGQSHMSRNTNSWAKYTDLENGGSLKPDIRTSASQTALSSSRLSAASGRDYDSSVSSRPTTVGSDNMWENPSRPPRASPPPVVSHAPVHVKGESIGSMGNATIDPRASPKTSLRGLDSMSATHEGYVTASQSVESGNGIYARSSPAQRFRIANPSPPTPSPPPISSANGFHRTIPSGSSRSSSHKSLPVLPPDAIPGSTSPSPQNSVNSTLPPVPPSEPSHSPQLSLQQDTEPKEGEEPEAFFVRNTYAKLDVTGVKGDGYEEGIERTRAKLGYDRRSVQLAAMNDAKEAATGEIPKKELEILTSVDRYGFFDSMSHDRSVLLPSAALSKPLQPLTQINVSCPPAPEPLTSIPKPPVISKEREARRIGKWGRMLEAERRDPGGNVSVWRLARGKERKLRGRVFKGIPDAWRSAAWEVLISRWVGLQKKKSLDASSLEEMLNGLRREYRSSIDRPSSYDVQIDLDVPRTINGHVLFKTRYGLGQRSLFHTLHSFSLVCNECGYCQGMGPLAATLLCYYEPEKVYATLVHFHDEYQMHDIFLPGFPGLLEAIYIQERILEKMLPAVFESFKKHMISTTSYATKWYITLFANSVPFQTQLRLWDVFLLEGRDVFILVAISIVWALKDHITSPQASFETILSLLSSFFIPEDEDVLLRWIGRALDDKRLRADMEKWRSDWKTLVKEGKEGNVLL